jgi:hypothetical protein
MKKYYDVEKKTESDKSPIQKNNEEAILAYCKKNLKGKKVVVHTINNKNHVEFDDGELNSVEAAALRTFLSSL